MGNEGYLSGKRLGIYQIDRRLGRGGMGEVYMAHDTALDRTVALKVLRSTLVHDEQLVERFHREARASAKLNHPNIVRIHSVGVEDGVPYFAMEWIDGEPLDAILKAQGTLPWQRAMNITGQVASALESAHAQGIIHRDIKPANILIDKSGRAHVTDFGVAKVLNARTQLTTEGTFIGTPQYMSPEQCGVGEISPASDLFSLGATAYEMLSGMLPFDGDTPATLIRKITQESPNPLSELVPGLPESVCTLVHRLLEKDAANRYQSAHEVLCDLERIRIGATLSESVTKAMHPKTSVIVKPASRTRSFAVSAVVGLLVALVAIGAFAARSKRKFGTPRQDATADKNTGPDTPATVSETELPVPPTGDLLARFDTNRSGALEPAEIPVSLSAIIAKADLDANGTLTRDELAAARKQLQGPNANLRDRAVQRTGIRKDMLTAEQVMAQFDKNADRVITEDEVPAEQKMFFQGNDLDKNGKITLEEVKENRARMLQKVQRRPGAQSPLQ